MVAQNQLSKISSHSLVFFFFLAAKRKVTPLDITGLPGYEKLDYGEAKVRIYTKGGPLYYMFVLACMQCQWCILY